MKRHGVFCVLSILATSACAQDSNGKFSGVFYGDFYSVLKHNDTDIEGKSGFWIRRIYLTYDRKIDEKLSAQLRIEAKDPGDFSTSSSMEPFIKDAWLRYSENGYKFTFGLIPTPTTGPAEEKLGYRPIEKTPLDLYKFGSTRDKGVSIQGPIGQGGKTDFMLMFGDASGTKSSDGETSAFYARIGHKVTDQIYADVYADCWDKADSGKWRTVKGELLYSGDRIKGGLLWAKQRRSASKAETLNLDVLSFYGEFKASEKLSPFIRLDVLGDAVPDAEKIEYWHMGEDGKPTLLMIGARYKLHDAIEVIPSLTSIRYRGGSSSSDSIFRLTFSAKL